MYNEPCSACGNPAYRCTCYNSTGTSPKPVGTKHDAGKLRYSLIPPEALKALAEVLAFGAVKYSRDNWQIVEDGPERYLDALYRHLEAHRSGELLDSDSGLSHLSHALTNLAFLVWFQTHSKDSNAV